MFNSSAQARSWMFKSLAELNKRREVSNRRFIQDRSNAMSVSNFMFQTFTQSSGFC